jgi:hypothetical protein
VSMTLGAGKRKTVMQILKAGVLYFALVFAAGFALGTIRVLWIVPRWGARTAELMETPVMLGASLLAARWVVRRLGLPRAAAVRLGAGLLALGLLLLAEFGVALPLRGLTIGQYFATLDPVAGTVYFVALGVFAVMPLLVGRR